MAHTLIGIVTSDQRDKTITVSNVARETHPLYRKQYSKTRKYTAHDEKNEAHKGDRVEIAETRPISKTKAYTLVRILERSHGTVELKSDVTEIDLPEKVGADEIARAKKAEEEAKEAEKTAKKAEKTVEKAEGEEE